MRYSLPCTQKRGQKRPQQQKACLTYFRAVQTIEKVIAEEIYNNANAQGLISREQFAYRPAHSTLLQLLETQNDWSLFVNDGRPFDCVYFDFKSAFESTT